MKFRLRMPGRRKLPAPSLPMPTAYSRTAIVIHWLTAAGIALVVALGLRMTETGGAERGRVQTLHMSIGILILLLTVLRLTWRTVHSPSLSPTLTGWQRRAAVATHTAFYLLLITVPLMGWMFVATSSADSVAPLLGFLPWPGGLAGNRSVAELAEGAHRVLAFGLCALVLLHAAAAIRHHLDAYTSARAYDARRFGVARDLQDRLGPVESMLARLDPLLAEPIALSAGEFEDLVRFVSEGLLDERARPQQLCRLVPAAVPSGRPLPRFQGCAPLR